jgi:hypothetical protein
LCDEHPATRAQIPSFDLDRPTALEDLGGTLYFLFSTWMHRNGRAAALQACGEKVCVGLRVGCLEQRVEIACYALAEAVPGHRSCAALIDTRGELDAIGRKAREHELGARRIGSAVAIVKGNHHLGHDRLLV